MADTQFQPLINEYYNNQSILKDQHELIRIENKTPILEEDKDIGNIVRGDTNSNILTFEIDRFYDGVDLTTKGVQIIVKNDDGIMVEFGTNIQYNDKFVRFSWIMSNFATSRKEVTAAIEFYGIVDDDKDYLLKTTPFTIKIKDSLDSADMNVFTVSDNLYVNLINRLIKIEKNIFEDSDDSFGNIEFESEPINFAELMGVQNIEETN